MSNHNKDSNEKLFTSEQERLIKNSFTQFEQNLGITSQTPDYLKRSFEMKLASLSKPKKPFFKNWGGFTASLLAAFSIGILISRFVMMPATVSTRSIGEEGINNQSTLGQAYVSKSVSNPKEYSFQIIAAALEANMEVEIIQAEGKYGLHIKPFKPQDKEQEKIRALLGVNPDISGTVNATIGPLKK